MVPDQRAKRLHAATDPPPLKPENFKILSILPSEWPSGHLSQLTGRLPVKCESIQCYGLLWCLHCESGCCKHIYSLVKWMVCMFIGWCHGNSFRGNVWHGWFYFFSSRLQPRVWNVITSHACDANYIAIYMLVLFNKWELDSFEMKKKMY